MGYPEKESQTFPFRSLEPRAQLLTRHNFFSLLEIKSLNYSDVFLQDFHVVSFARGRPS